MLIVAIASFLSVTIFAIWVGMTIFYLPILRLNTASIMTLLCLRLQCYSCTPSLVIIRSPHLTCPSCLSSLTIFSLYILDYLALGCPKVPNLPEECSAGDIRCYTHGGGVHKPCYDICPPQDSFSIAQKCKHSAFCGGESSVTHNRWPMCLLFYDWLLGGVESQCQLSENNL